MSDYEDQMNSMLDQMGGMVNLTVEEREEVTKSGADVLKKNMPTVTPYNGRRKHGGLDHLRDSFEVGQIQGEPEDGHTGFGFTKKGKDGVNHARIARFVNDGTVKKAPTHFIDKGFIQFQGAVNEAMAKKLSDVQLRKAKK